jgi:16S rRNA (cytosine1402-N4)-methyltransferase
MAISMEHRHESVMIDEVKEFLPLVESAKLFVDATLGDGGHAGALLATLGSMDRVIGIDQDAEALARAISRLAPFADRLMVVRDNFSHIAEVVAGAGFSGVDFILADLGVSLHQLKDGNKGFSFSEDGPLDMRMDQRSRLTAADIVNSWPADKIADVLWKYGEEKKSRQIARRLVEARVSQPFQTTAALANFIGRIAGHSNRDSHIHPATLTFQALRIAVNDELGNLEKFLAAAVNCLTVGGRLVVISYHSLEDRIVKKFFQMKRRGCICPSDFPTCCCGKEPELTILTSKPRLPSATEIAKNPRARSAKMRVAEKIATSTRPEGT